LVDGTFDPKRGWLLILPDKDEDRAGRILFPDSRRRKRSSGIVLIHNHTSWWDAYKDYVENRRVIFDRWSWKPITLGSREFWLIPERNILAIIEEDNMDRDRMIAEIAESIKQRIEGEFPENRELKEDDLVEIQGIVDATSIEEIDELDDEEDGEEAEAGTEK
jgi:co-chaperonin GroES (HSP10)